MICVGNFVLEHLDLDSPIPRQTLAETSADCGSLESVSSQGEARPSTCWTGSSVRTRFGQISRVNLPEGFRCVCLKSTLLNSGDVRGKEKISFCSCGLQIKVHAKSKSRFDA